MPQDTYQDLLNQLKDTPNQQTVREFARQTANHGVVTLLAGKLAAVLAAGVKAAFIPDVVSQHIEIAKTVLVGVFANMIVGKSNEQMDE